MLDGYLLDRVQIEQVGPGTVVRRRSGAVFEIREADGGVTLQFGRKVIADPDLDLLTLRFILDTPRFRTTELPGPAETARKVDLAKKLIRAGVLELAD